MKDFNFIMKITHVKFIENIKHIYKFKVTFNEPKLI